MGAARSPAAAVGAPSASRALAGCTVALIDFLGTAVVGHAAGKSTGALIYKGCMTQSAGCGSGNNGITGLNGARGVAVSADGKSVYVGSSASQAIALFRRR